MRRWWGLSGGMPRALVAGLALALLCASSLPGRTVGADPPDPDDGAGQAVGLVTVIPEVEGFESARLAAAIRALADAGRPVHALVVVRHDGIVLDARFHPYDGTSPHQTGSITKAVLTTLLGIAVDRGWLRLDDRVLDILARDDEPSDARWARLTVADLASMTSGLACSDGDGVTLSGMLASADWVGYVLGLRMASEPGRVLTYCSPAMHLLAAVLEAATGVPPRDLARQFLFGPLGIADPPWQRDPSGLDRGDAGLYLRPLDLARFGALWAADGTFAGRRVVSASWVREATHTHLASGGRSDYGYGWWIPADDSGEIVAVGDGGQRLAVVRALGLVMVTVAGGLTFDAHHELRVALTSPNGPLDIDRAGQFALTEALDEIAVRPRGRGAVAIPSGARTADGVTWHVRSNPAGLATMRFDIESRTAIRVAWTYTDGRAPRTGLIGLDGVARVGPGVAGLPSAMLGRWLDTRTLELEVDDIAEGTAQHWQVRFGAARLRVDGHDRTGGGGWSATATRGR